MEENIINNIRSLGIDMISNAGSGHPGIVLDAAPTLYTLFTRHLNINVNDEKWLNRDRFIMSAGHGSALLYSILYMAGYLTIEDLKGFRQIDSKTPGHPEYLVTPSVEMSTGPLGQGFASAVGFALGEKILENRYKTSKGESLFNYKVYILCGDGDLMEGISYEAASLAGTWKLNNLIVLYDSNNTSLDGPTINTFNENVRLRFEALGWNTEYVSDGENVKDIDKAIEKAKNSKKPTLIEIKTIIGKGSYLEGKHEVHGKVLEPTDVKQLKIKWNLEFEPFYTLPNAREEFQKKITEHTKDNYNKWALRYKDFSTYKDINSLNFLYKKEEYDILSSYYDFELDKEHSTRELNSYIMNTFSKHLPNFITGSADLFSSVKNYINNGNDILPEEYTGQNIWFGVREHAMGAILNGLSLTGFRVSGSTFLTFSDYLKPAMRMSSLMHQPVTYIFSHDSISIGSDGPTHQPVEQLAMLRSMPNMNVFRPSDAYELLGCWNEILKSNETPSSLILSKQNKSSIKGTSIEGVSKGAYIVRKEDTLHGIIISTGDELHTSLRIAHKLKETIGLDLRVVSMPCMELFLKQDKKYQESILPKGIRTVVIEASSSLSWYRFVYNDSYLLTIDTFGASGSKNQILKKYNYDYQSLENRVKELFM